MIERYDDDVRTISVVCAECGTLIELAQSALEVFESEDNILCMECLVRSTDASATRVVPLEERIGLIDEVIEDFAQRLRQILVRSVRSDLSWNSTYSHEDWSDPADSAVAAHAPGIWYAGKSQLERRRSSE